MSLLNRTLLAVTLASAVTLAGDVFAQHTATVVLRSGDRVSGELIDYNASGFVMRVNGQDRAIPASEVANV